MKLSLGYNPCMEGLDSIRVVQWRVIKILPVLCNPIWVIRSEWATLNNTIIYQRECAGSVISGYIGFVQSVKIIDCILAYAENDIVVFNCRKPIGNGFVRCWFHSTSMECRLSRAERSVSASNNAVLIFTRTVRASTRENLSSYASVSDLTSWQRLSLDWSDTNCP